MNWTKRGAIFESTDGYRIAAFHGPRAPVYLAYAPEIPFEVFRRTHRVRYAVGEQVPQLRPLLGCFAEPAAALAACDAHHARPISPGI